MIIKTYGGYIKDFEKLKKSASGGLATAMSEEIILNNGIVYGVAYTCDFKSAEYRRIDKISGLDILRGSKYIKPTLKLPILELLSQDLACEKKVLFIGLPCDINVVKNYVAKHGIDSENLLCVDLICHGPTSNKVADEYITRLERKYKSKVKSFNVRYKNPFWTPPYLFVEFENGKVLKEVFYQTDYGTAFFLMVEEKCYKCKFKGENYKSDITIGDYWGFNESDDGYNKYGSSVAFVHTQKGQGFITSLNNFNLYEADTEKALKGNQRYLTPTALTAEREIFKKRFIKKGLAYAVSKHIGRKAKIKRIIKKLYYHLLKKR